MYLNSIKEWVDRKAKHSKYLRRENSPKQLKYIKQNFHENKGNNKITELRTILQRESQNS